MKECCEIPVLFIYDIAKELATSNNKAMFTHQLKGVDRLVAEVCGGVMTINFDTIDYNVISSSQMPTDTMQELVDTCGVKTAILLMEHFGGRSLAIPSKRKTGLYDEIVNKCGEVLLIGYFRLFQVNQ